MLYCSINTTENITAANQEHQAETQLVNLINSCVFPQVCMCVCIPFISTWSGFQCSSDSCSPECRRVLWNTVHKRMVWGGRSAVCVCHRACSCSRGPQDNADKGWRPEGSQEERRLDTTGREAHSSAGSRKTSQTDLSDWCPRVQEAGL